VADLYTDNNSTTITIGGGTANTLTVLAAGNGTVDIDGSTDVLIDAVRIFSINGGPGNTSDITVDGSDASDSVLAIACNNTGAGDGTVTIQGNSTSGTGRVTIDANGNLSSAVVDISATAFTTNLCTGTIFAQTLDIGTGASATTIRMGTSGSGDITIGSTSAGNLILRSGVTTGNGIELTSTGATIFMNSGIGYNFFLGANDAFNRNISFNADNAGAGTGNFVVNAEDQIELTSQGTAFDAIDINSSGGIDIDAVNFLGINLSGTGAMTIATNDGNLLLQAGGASRDLRLQATDATGNIRFLALGGTQRTYNQSGDIDFNATILAAAKNSIIGAINGLQDGSIALAGGGGSLQSAYDAGNTVAKTASTPVVLSGNGDNLVVRGDAVIEGDLVVGPEDSKTFDSPLNTEFDSPLAATNFRL
jgi:hypothetical protein